MSSQRKSLPTNNEELEKANKIKAMKQRIEELRTCLTHLEYEVGADKFKNIENLIVNNNEGVPPIQPLNRRAVDVETQFYNDLFRFGGFNCMRATEEEFIFNLSSGREYSAKHDYLVEILIKNGNLSVGRWVMPPSVDKDILNSEVQMKSTKDIPLFLSNCKQHITCYVRREEQYNVLQEMASKKKNCSVQSNLGITVIIIDFLNVRDTEQNVKVNLRVNILYNAKEVRPCAIMIEKLGLEELSREALKHLKKSLKPFKLEDLNTAFEKVLLQENGPFVWPPPVEEVGEFDTNENEDSDELEDKSFDSLDSPKKRRRADASDDSDDPDYEEKSASYSRSEKKKSASPSRKRKPLRPAGNKKTNIAKKSKKNSGSASHPKPKLQQSLQFKK